MMLGIGSVQGGPEVASAPIGKIIDRLMKLAAEERGDFQIGSVAAVNLVYHVPGSIISQLDHQGLRDGTFSRKQKLLMIQVAVPREIAASESEEEVMSFLLWSLEEANYLAAKYFKKKGIDYSQPKFLALVDAIKGRLAQC